jgi:hypothetical protein
MKKIKDFLTSSLGVFGILIFYILSILVTVYPLIMFEMPWWLYMVLALIVQLVIVNIPFGLEILWIVGLVGAISGKQDIFAVIYYVLFALIVGSTIINLLKIFLSKDGR